MQATWCTHPADSRTAGELAHAVGIHPITAQLLLNRGIRTAQDAMRFLTPGLETLEEPTTLPGLARSVARLRRAIAKREPILIFGDSDVDGLSASVILFEALRELGAMVQIKLSNRVADGYGIPQALIRQICRSSTQLVILVDCGTNQSQAVRLLATHGIDTIIVDHHVPLDAPARPAVLVNPHCQQASRWRELSSAGLAFKVVQALLGNIADERPSAYLDVAALGILADYSPMVGESRAIVAAGLQHIVRSDRPGLRRLCEATRTSKPVPDQIIRRLVPKLNASGRLGDPIAIWNLLLREPDGDLDTSMAAAEQAHATTKQLHRDVLGEACEQVNRLNFKDHYVLVVSRSGWHQGVMGPLASQLAERYGRPTIALAMDEQCGIGSGRSIPVFNLLQALQACQDLLMSFGGHAQACGLTLERKRLEQFRALVNQYAEVSVGRQGLLKTRAIDLELPLSEIQPQWVEETERFAPFGNGNQRPTVVIRRLTIDARSPRTAILSDGTTRVFSRGQFPDEVLGGRYDVVASPAVVEGQLMLAVSDVKTALSGPAQI